MSTPLEIGPSVDACRHALARRSRRRVLQFGVSLLAMAAIAPAARAQVTVGPGATVTNNNATTSYYVLNGNGGTLITLGTIASPSAVAIQAEESQFQAGYLSSYPISDVSLVNSGLITATSTNVLAGIGVNGLTVTNSGTMTNTGASFPALYLNNVNNLQLSNTGLIAVNSTGSQARVANLYTVTNSTLVNQGTMAIMSVTDSLPALFVSAQSANVTITNNGTISTVGGGQALMVGNNSLNTFTTTIDSANVITEQPVATNITLNNTGVMSSNNLAMTIGGMSSVVAVTNSGTIITTSTSGTSAITVQDAASNVGIANSGLVVNAGTGSAIDVSTSGSGVTISNTGLIAEAGGNGIAIDHVNGTSPLTINTSGNISGAIRLSQPGDLLTIGGGAINGAVMTTTPGAGTVVLNAPGGFNSNGDFGSAASPLGAIEIAGGSLNLSNALWANSVSFGPGSTTTLLGTVNAVANNGNLNLAGGTLSLGTSALVLGSNATVRTSTADGSTIAFTIGGTQNGLINARAGNATIDTSANTLVIRPNIFGAAPKMGAQYAVIETSSGANVGNALAKISIAPGPDAALFSVGTATSTTDAYGNPLTPGKDIVVTVTGSTASVTNAALAASDPQIVREQVNAVVSGITERIGDAIANAIAGAIGIGPVVQPGVAGGDEAAQSGPAHNWTVWMDTSGSFLKDTASASPYNGSIWTGLAGVDQPLTDDIIVGTVVGGEGDAFDLSTGRRSSTGISITPYAAYILNAWSSVDVELSYARLDNHVMVDVGTPVNSHYATNRVFAAGNLAAYWNADAFTLRGKVGFLIANDGGPRYTDSTGVRATPPSTTLQEAKIGGEATYHFGQFVPFANATLVDDLRGYGGLNSELTGVSSPSRYGLQYDAGLRYTAEGGIQVGFQGGGETLRGTQSSVMGGIFARIPL
jgi:hypothetical protein